MKAPRRPKPIRQKKIASPREITRLRLLRPTPLTKARHSAFLAAGATIMRCSIGRAGVTRDKREGDGATPAGDFRLLSWYFQPVRPAFFQLPAPRRIIRKNNGWCDDFRAGAYNRPISLPSRYSHESLWRDDGKYAVIGVLDYNLRPRRVGAGSAIFFHLCAADYAPTAGCIAITAAHMRKLLPRLSPRAKIMIR